MSIGTEFDYNKICRTCLSVSENMVGLYAVCSVVQLSPADLLDSFTSLKCSNCDGLPSHICGSCYNVIKHFHEFRLKCLESDTKLRKCRRIRDTNEQLEHEIVNIKKEIEDNSPLIGLDTIKIEEINLEVQLQNDLNQEVIKQEIKLDELSSEIDLGSAVFVNEQMSTAGATGEQDKHSCTKCAKSFLRKCHLNRHMRTHTPAKPYVCPFCDSSYKRNDTLTVHMRTHTGETPYTCTLCPKSFRRWENLAGHKRVHAGLSFVCAICGSSFQRKGNLEVHMRTHTGSKPYACAACDAAFTYKFSLIAHMREHSEQKQYFCSVCDTSFVVKSAFTEHVRGHCKKPFACTICDNSYTSSYYLRAHLRTHSSDRPYTCDVCGKTFCHILYFNAHMRVHNKNTLYSCSVCGTAFNIKSDLADHMEEHVEVV